MRRTEGSRTAKDEARPGRAARRLELVDRKEALEGKLRRTRLTVPLWIAGVLWFLAMGFVYGNLVAAGVMGAFAALAAGVMHGARRRQKEELARVEDALTALPDRAGEDG